MHITSNFPVKKLYIPFNISYRYTIKYATFSLKFEFLRVNSLFFPTNDLLFLSDLCFLSSTLLTPLLELFRSYPFSLLKKEPLTGATRNALGRMQLVASTIHNSIYAEHFIKIVNITNSCIFFNT